MTTDQFRYTLVVSTLISVAIATFVAVQFHWLWGVVAYFITDFILYTVVIACFFRKLK